MRKALQRMYNCINGPLNGTKLSLATPVTMPFTINGKSGRYRPALFDITGYDFQGHKWTRPSRKPDHVSGDTVSKIRYLNCYDGNKDIYWEPL